VEEIPQTPEAPQPAPPAYPPPVAQQWTPQQAPPPIPGKFLALCVAGIVLLTCGVLIITSSQFIVDLESTPWDGGYDRNLVKNIGVIGKILSMIGTMLLVLGMMAAGFMARDISPNTRMGLFIAAGLIVGLVFGMALMYSFFPIIG